MQIFLSILTRLVGVVVGIGVAVSALLGGISHTAVSALSHPVAINATTTGATFPAATSTAAEKSVPQNGLVEPTQTVTRGPFAGQISSVATTTIPSIPSLSSTQLNAQTRAALVNIECTTIAGGTFEPISGSGIVVDSDGVILTNAHVAQFFLLRDYYQKNNIQCVIRTGSPATNAYTAELLYLPPAWVTTNADQIVSQEPTGDGQNDFAFLYITGTTNGSAFGGNIPYLSLSTAAPDIGDSMLLAAYPAGFLSGQLIATQLYSSSAFAYVTQLFSYAATSSIPTLLPVDLFSVGGSIESQQGSSGGAVVNQAGQLLGIIDTDTTAASTGERDLRAVTIDYINRQLQISGKLGITGLLSGDLTQKAADFNANIAPQETAELEAVLNQANGTN